MTNAMLSVSPNSSDNEIANAFWKKNRAFLTLTSDLSVVDEPVEMAVSGKANAASHKRSALPLWVQNIAHVKANPSQELNSVLVEAFYVPGNPENASEHIRQILNQHPLNADGHIPWVNSTEGIEASKNRWAEKAVAFGNGQLATAIAPVEFIVGDVGSGKTFFQNYFVTHNSRWLDKKNVIWLRINLTRDILFQTKVDEDLHVDLLGWVEAQATKVIARYYDCNSKYCRKTDPPFDLLGDFRKIETGGEPSLRRLWTKEILDRSEQMLSRLYGHGVDQEIAPGWMPGLATQYVFNRAIELGFRFIVAFDGLDQLAFTHVSEAHFGKLFKATLSLVTAETRPKFFSLVFLRPASIIRVDEHFFQFSTKTTWKIGDCQVSGLAPANASRLLKRRRQALEDPKNATILGTEVDEIRKVFAFLRKDGDEEELGHGKNFLEVSRSLYPWNARAMFQVIHAGVEAFLLRGNQTAHAYELTEFLVRGSMEFPPTPPKYSYSERALVRTTEGLSGWWYDNRFLPSIFTFPQSVTESTKELSDEIRCGLYLLGLRVLQVCLTADSLSENGAQVRLTKDSLVTLLQHFFGYNEVRATRLVEEYIECELIGQYSQSIFSGAPSSGDRLSLLPKGRAILSRYLFDLSYLSLSSLSLQVPSVFLNAGHPRYISGRRPMSFGGSFSEYMIAKLSNAVSLAKIVIALNESQRRSFIQRAGHTNVRFASVGQRTIAAQLILDVNSGRKENYPHSGLFYFDEKLEILCKATWERSYGGINADETRRAIFSGLFP